MLTLTKLLNLTKGVDALARVLMSLLFLISGVGKLAAVVPTQAYMQAYGVPGLLIWPAAAWEIGGGLLLLTGLWVRPLALPLAGMVPVDSVCLPRCVGRPASDHDVSEEYDDGGRLLSAREGRRARLRHGWRAFFPQR